MTVRILTGDCRQVLRTLAEESVHCCITSPPYWGLRDYGIPPTVWGGDLACEHSWGEVETVAGGKQPSEKVRWQHEPEARPNGHIKSVSAFCHCGAWRGAHGLEPSIDLYVRNAVEIFRAVRRVLRNDGVCWINLGDSYSAKTEMTYIMREDCSDEEVSRVGLVMFGMRFDGYEASSQGTMRSLLQSQVESGPICDRSNLESKGIETAISEEQNREYSPGKSAEQENEGRGDKGFGRPVRLLRRGSQGISDSGSRQRGRCSAQEKTVKEQQSELSSVVDQGVSRNQAQGISEGRISSSLLELQLRDRIVRALSSREFAASEIPSNLRSCFRPVGLKPKDLIGVPWRVAFALQADGWWLRSEIIWAKPNPMPESVTDRPTKSHEQIFLLTKSAKYYYDAEAIKEDASKTGSPAHLQGGAGERAGTREGLRGAQWLQESGRNKRSVWTVATSPFPEAHFATFPPELIEPCIKAGTSEKGCCAKCGAPWERVVKRERTRDGEPLEGSFHGTDGTPQKIGATGVGHWRDKTESTTLGWRPTCKCAAAVVPATVLDPFAGAGTAGLVADRLQRNAILIELNPTYAAMAKRRIAADAPLLSFDEARALCAQREEDIRVTEKREREELMGAMSRLLGPEAAE